MLKLLNFLPFSLFFEYLQNLARQANMKYVNVTLDCGAAISANKTIMAVSKEVWKCNHPPWRLSLYERKLPGIMCCWSLREILPTTKVQTERAGLRAMFHAQMQLLLYLLSYTGYLQSKVFRKNLWKEKTFLKKGPKY